ncbi:unnamed protein product [Closterium sp. NIES-65]|nr:unnamed protein product [Closterium sp. NIES-65]
MLVPLHTSSSRFLPLRRFKSQSSCSRSPTASTRGMLVPLHTSTSSSRFLPLRRFKSQSSCSRSPTASTRGPFVPPQTPALSPTLPLFFVFFHLPHNLPFSFPFSQLLLLALLTGTANIIPGSGQPSALQAGGHSFNPPHPSSLVSCSCPLYSHQLLLLALLTVSLGVANRVLYKLALIPLHRYPFFLAQLTTFGKHPNQPRGPILFHHPSYCPTTSLFPCRLACCGSNPSLLQEATSTSLFPCRPCRPRLPCPPSSSPLSSSFLPCRVPNPPPFFSLISSPPSLPPSSPLYFLPNSYVAVYSIILLIRTSLNIVTPDMLTLPKRPFMLMGLQISSPHHVNPNLLSSPCQPKSLLITMLTPNLLSSPCQAKSPLITMSPPPFCSPILLLAAAHMPGVLIPVLSQVPQGVVPPKQLCLSYLFHPLPSSTAHNLGPPHLFPPLLPPLDLFRSSWCVWQLVLSYLPLTSFFNPPSLFPLHTTLPLFHPPLSRSGLPGVAARPLLSPSHFFLQPSLPFSSAHNLAIVPPSSLPFRSSWCGGSSSLISSILSAVLHRTQPLQIFLVWQLTLSYVFLGRRYSPQQLLGCFLVIVGVAVVVVTSGPPLHHVSTLLASLLAATAIQWPLLFIVSTVFPAASSIIKESVFRNSAKKLNALVILILPPFPPPQALFILILPPFPPPQALFILILPPFPPPQALFILILPPFQPPQALFILILLPFPPPQALFILILPPFPPPQALFVLILLPLISSLGYRVPPAQLPGYFREGAACLFNFNQNIPGSAPAPAALRGSCQGAPLLPLLYVAANLAFNISLLALLKKSSAVIASLSMTLTVLAFTLPLPLLGPPQPLRGGVILGTLVLLLGLAAYNLATPGSMGAGGEGGLKLAAGKED